MKIAHLSPLHESVPPELYGGTQRVIHWLIEESLRQGHEVVLYGSADSTTSAELRPICDRGLRSMDLKSAEWAFHLVLTERLKREAAEFDVIHSHLEYVAYPALKGCTTPHVSTMHNRLDTPQQTRMLAEFPSVPLISISDSQRTPVPGANWLRTIYHGMPLNSLECGSGSGDYLVFLGRISPDKGPVRAVEIANRAGLKLKIAAKLDEPQKDYFESEVKPRLGKTAEFIGEVDNEEKQELLQNARAFLFPIDWPEPFGLVMIEAMACGTPVIGWRSGSVPEVIDEEVTGFVVESIEEAAERVDQCKHFDRIGCRSHFEKRFSAERMTSEYLEIYSKLQFQTNGIEKQQVREGSDETAKAYGASLDAVLRAADAEKTQI